VLQRQEKTLPAPHALDRGGTIEVVGPDRFDDVEYTVLEHPEPPRRPRLQRWMLAPLASILIIGSLAAGASAVTGDGTSPTPSDAATAPPKADYDGFRGCEKGERHGKRERPSSGLSY
jgi:hypothetical protein